MLLSVEALKHRKEEMQTCSPAMSIFSRTLNFWPISLSFGTQYSTMLLNCNKGRF